MFAFFSIPKLPKSQLIKLGFWGVAIFYGLATVVVSIFPCDEGCGKELNDASASQIIHNLVGLLTYLFVPVCLIIIGAKAKEWFNGKRVSLISFLCGGLTFVFIAILISNPLSNYAGLYQRLIEGSILSWIVCIAFYIKKMKVDYHKII